MQDKIHDYSEALLSSFVRKANHDYKQLASTVIRQMRLNDLYSPNDSLTPSQRVKYAKKNGKLSNAVTIAAESIVRQNTRAMDEINNDADSIYEYGYRHTQSKLQREVDQFRGEKQR